MKSLVFFGIFFIFIFHSDAKPSIDGRIVGGENTTIEEYPYQISLELNDRHDCGGSIISTNIILTAAHCTAAIKDITTLKVRAGSTIREQGGIVRKIKTILNHELWNQMSIDYDVSLILLKDPLPLSKRIQPIQLPNENEYLKGQEKAVVIGWGNTDPNGFTLALVLQKADIEIVEQSKCNESYSGKITPRMMCAGLYGVGGKDTCRSDSGGPLVSNNKLHGITSWGGQCGGKWTPGVYTRVTEIREWIREKVNL